MADRVTQQTPNEPPEDVASLYSWANLHGAKYRDFSASRALNRERTRIRVQEEAEQERQLAIQKVEAAEAAQARQSAEAARNAAEQAHQAEVAAQMAAHETAAAAQRFAQERAWQAEEAAQRAAHEEKRIASEEAARVAAEEQMRVASQDAARRAVDEQVRMAADEASTAQALAATMARSAQQKAANVQPTYPTASWMPARATFPVATTDYRQGSPAAAMREEPFTVPASVARPGQDSRDYSTRPAWLTQRFEPVSTPAPMQSPEDTLQGSRDRITARWFALKSVLDGSSSSAESAAEPAQAVSRVPVLAVFSLSGGVGKTSLTATLARALSARGERVLIAETASFGLLPFFFGAHDQRFGQLRTFSPPSSSSDAPIQMVSFDPGALGPEDGPQEGLESGITRNSQNVNRIIVDVSTASASITRRLMKLAPRVLVPVVPDMSSVVSVNAIDSFFEQYSGGTGKLPYYVLNQFDPSLPLHLDVREVLREKLGDRLLGFALRRSPAVSEALAEGMTVMDYAPGSGVAEDFGSLASWVKSTLAPAHSSFRGVRWSER